MAKATLYVVHPYAGGANKIRPIIFIPTKNLLNTHKINTVQLIIKTK